MTNLECLGIGKSLLLILLFSCLKSEMKRTVSLFLDIIKVGASNLELFFCFNTPIFINLLTSVFRVSLCILRIEKGLAWYGLPSSKSSIFYSKPVQLPNVPSNISSYFVKKFRIKDCSLLLIYFKLCTISLNEFFVIGV